MRFEKGDKVCVEVEISQVGDSVKHLLIKFENGSQVWVHSSVEKIYHAGGECEVKNV